MIGTALLAFLALATDEERRFTLAARLETPARILLPLDDDWQRVIAFDSPARTVLGRDRATGTRWLDVPAGAPRPAEVRITVACRPAVVADGAAARQRLPAKTLEPWSATPGAPFAEEGRKLAGPEPSARARAARLFAAVRARIALDAAGPADAAAAWAAGKGTEAARASAFVALCRGGGLPARLEGGWAIVGEAAAARLGPAKSWACFHDPDRGWTPVDVAAAAGLGDAGGRRVAFWRGAAPADARAAEWTLQGEGP